MTDEYDNSKCLMWPAVFPGSENIKDPHVTVVYLGDDPDLEVDPQVVLSALYKYLDAPGEIAVKGVEIFGDEEKVWVAVLDPVPLVGVRSDIKTLLHDELGLQDASSWPTYKPHVTLGPVDGSVDAPEAPDTVELKPLEIWLGEKHYYAIM